MESTHDEEARQKEFGLTPRELKIVSAVVAGYSNKEIAEYFKISEDSVTLHLSNIFDKLGVSLAWNLRFLPSIRVFLSSLSDNHSHPEWHEPKA